MAAILAKGIAPRALGVAVVAVVFLPALMGAFLWDDYALILQSEAVREFRLGELLTQDFWDVPNRGFSSQLYYRPVVKLAHAVQWALFGEDAFGYRLTNLLLHLLCTLLGMSWLDRRLATGHDLSSGMSLAAVMAVGLFALHPSRVQSVAWASGSTDLWACLFLLAGLVLWERLRGPLGTALAVTAFVFAFFSKEATIVAPFLLLTDALLLSETHQRRAAALRVAWVGAGLVGAVAVRTVLVGVPGGGPEGFLSTTGLQRGVYTLGAYVEGTVFPWFPRVQSNAAMDAIERDAYYWARLGSGLLFVGLSSGLALLARRRKELRPWLADLLWFLVPLLPTLNLIPIGRGVTIAERMLYIPLLGAAALTARATGPLLSGAPNRRLITLVAAGALAIGCAAVTVRHIEDLHDDESLTRHLLERDAEDLFALDGLTRVLMRKGEIEEAFELATRRLDLKAGDDLERAAVLTWTYLKLMLTSDSQQETLLAIRGFLNDVADTDRQHAQLVLPNVFHEIELSEPVKADILHNPLYGDFYDHLGMVRARTLDLDGASVAFGRWKEVAEGNPHAWERPVRLRAWSGDWTGALQMLEEARARFPEQDWAPMTSLVERGATLGSHGTDPVEHASQRSRLMSELGLPVLGRRLLAPFLGHADIRIVHAMVQSFISDKRYDLAKRQIELARTRFEDHAVELDAALQEVAAHERNAPFVRGRSGLVPQQ